MADGALDPAPEPPSSGERAAEAGASVGCGRPRSGARGRIWLSDRRSEVERVRASAEIWIRFVPRPPFQISSRAPSVILPRPPTRFSCSAPQLARPSPPLLLFLHNLFSSCTTCSRPAYNQLLRTLFGEKRVEEAARVFDYMRKKYVLTTTSFMVMISGLSTEKEMRKAMKVHDEMLKLGLKPSPKTYRSLISIFRSTFEKEMASIPTTHSVGDFPPELYCVLCNQVMRDAVLANKCCLNSFCDKCIRDNIISKSSCVWGAKDVLAEDLIPKKTLRDIITHISDSSSSSNNSVRSNSDSSSSSSSNDSNNSSSKSDLERKHDRESVSSDHKTRADQAGDPNKKRKLSSGPKPLSHTRTCVPCVPLQVR